MRRANSNYQHTNRENGNVSPDNDSKGTGNVQVCAVLNERRSVMATIAGCAVERTV